MSGDVRRWRLLYGDPTRQVSQKAFGFFLEDDVKATQHVTLNLGLRYDVTDPIKDAHNLLANYVPTSASGLVQVGQGISSPYPTNYNNISPRIGMAWDVFGTGKTILRSGFGIIFEQPSIRTFMFNGGGLNLNPSGIPYVDANGVTQTPDRHHQLVPASFERWHVRSIGSSPISHRQSSRLQPRGRYAASTASATYSASIST